MNMIKSPKKFRVSYCLPETLLSDVKEKMISDGYDLKGKSKWISEAISNLLVITEFSELVNLSDQMSGFQKLDSVSIDLALKVKLDSAIKTVRQHYPLIEGVQSKILRTAIVQRLLR